MFRPEQDDTPAEVMYPMPAFFRKKLNENKLMAAFDQLTPYRKKEIIRYLNHLKTDEARERNVEKVMGMRKKG